MRHLDGAARGLSHHTAVEALNPRRLVGQELPHPSVHRPARCVVKHRKSILAAIELAGPTERIESVNTKIRLITRVDFGFRSPEALIALARLNLGGHRPAYLAGNEPRISQEVQT